MITSLSKKYLPKTRLRKLAYGVLITLPVIVYVFKFSLLYRNGIFHGEDWDYFAQSYEAARLSVLHYHQFPWWNPWMNGGQPLFANPQFGLFSLQMPLVLLFGTVAGLHYSILLYFVLGFWGMYLLLQRIGSNSKLISVLLSYIWIFSGFNGGHLGGGQYTFTMYLLAPWAFLTVLNIHKRRGWLWFGLVASLMILTAMHYLTFEALLICVLIAAAQVSREIYKKRLVTMKNLMPVLKPYILALALILVLCGIRMFYTFQFTHEFTRLVPLDHPESVNLFLASLLFRSGVKPAALAYGAGAYGWVEYADYAGVITIALFCYLVIKRLERLKAVNLREWSILLAIVVAGLITLGGFSSISPYSLLHGLPIFNQMRVPSRFVGWVVFGIILFLTRLPRKPIIYALLAVSVVDVFGANYSLIGYNEQPYRQASFTSASKPFEQYEFFEASPSLGQVGVLKIQNLRLLRATQENYGEIYGYEPILNTGEYYYLPGTTRCGVNKGCPFVITKNAVVTKWSPLRIDLRRTGPGGIEVNMNPGKVWSVNGKNIFKTDHLLELEENFVIHDQSKNINITYHPVRR